MFRVKKLVGKKSSVVNYKSFTFYRDNAKHRNKNNTKDFVDHGKIISKIYKKIAESVVEYEGGFFAKRFMYVVPQIYPNKVIATVPTTDGLDVTMNSHTNGRFATILFVNLLGKKYEPWSMDNAFFRTLRVRLSKKLKEYRPEYLFSLKSLLKVSA